MAAQAQPMALVPISHALSLARTGLRATASRPLRIAQVAPLYEAVPPKLYGGTERVVSYLTEELVRRGHTVTLFASGDSRTAGAARAGGATRAAPRTPPARDPLAPHVLELAQVFDRAAASST